MDKYKQEKSYISIIKTILKDKTSDAVKEIEKENNVYDFIEESKESPKELEKIVGKENAKKILEIIKKEKKKVSILKKEFKLTTTNPQGLTQIKSILKKVSEEKIEIKYHSGGKYTIKAESENLKKADQKIQEIFEKIKEESKEKSLEFHPVEKK